MTKNVLITGASKGIGKAISTILAQNNYNVFLSARNENLLKNLATTIVAKGYFVGDLSANNVAENLFNHAKNSLGNIDILINNVGSYVYSDIENTQNTDIDYLFDLNIKLPIKLIRATVPDMKKNKFGRIVNIGSISGVIGESSASLYSATKSALSGLTKSLALELAEYNITINTINPGWVDTELAQQSVNECDCSEKELINMIPQRRYIEPIEIANLVKYLISNEAKGLTGQSISLCAGLSVG